MRSTKYEYVNGWAPGECGVVQALEAAVWRWQLGHSGPYLAVTTDERPGAGLC